MAEKSKSSTTKSTGRSAPTRPHAPQASEPRSVKQEIIDSHTDEGLDAARTERVVDTSLRVADA